MAEERDRYLKALVHQEGKNASLLKGENREL